MSSNKVVARAVRSDSIECEYIPNDLMPDGGAAPRERGAEVWVADPKELWEEAFIKDVLPDGMCIVKSISGKKRKVPSAHLPFRNPDVDEDGRNGTVGYENMSHLPYLHEPALLYNLHQRFAKDHLYTYTGCMLIAMNPFKWLDIYGPKQIGQYKDVELNQAPPHAFAIAEKCYRNMRKELKSQSVLVSGESGSGKTETVKIIMRYLAAVSGGGSISSTSDQVLKTNPILEAFGNAKTVRNNNSSRFGKFIDIQFNTKGQVIGASIQTYLLEKSRIVRQSEGERNYHILYQICSPAGADMLKEFVKMRAPKEFHYLNQSSLLTAPGKDDAKEFQETKEAMDVVGMSAKEQLDVFRLVAAVLYTGELSFSPDPKNNDHFMLDENEGLKCVCSLLACDKKDLQKALTSRTLTTRNETYTVPLTQEQCYGARDAFAKGLYGKMFLWLVDRINQSIQSKDQVAQCIGVLDIFGFESFDSNSFEQLCINYANEKLQQQFIQNVLKSEQEEYKLENIRWNFVAFVDNQECLDLLEKKSGILSLLDEECVFPKGSDESFTAKVIASHVNQKPNKYLSTFKPEKGKKGNFDPKLSFTIRHYARAVTYDTTNFLEKNKDYFPPEAIDFLKKTKFPFVASLYADAVAASAGGKAIKGPPSVSAQFKDQLGQLMQRLAPTSLHYISCIKPNTILKPEVLEKGFVCGQLRCAGVLEAIQVSRSMYPYRLKHSEFVSRFGFMVKVNPKEYPDAKSRCVYMLNTLIPDPDESRYQVGKTKVFFCPGVLEEMEEIRAAKFSKLATIVQSRFRTHLVRRRVKRVKRVLPHIQALVRRRIAIGKRKKLMAQFRKTAILSALPRSQEVSDIAKSAEVGNGGKKSSFANVDKAVKEENKKISTSVSTSGTMTSQVDAVYKKIAAQKKQKGMFMMAQKMDTEDIDDARAIELHIADLFALLTTKYEREQMVRGFKAFYVLYGRKAHSLSTVNGFADPDLMALLLNAIKVGPGEDWPPADWNAAVMALLSMFAVAEANARSITEMNGLQLSLLQMRHYEADTVVQTYGCAIVANCCKHETIRKYLKKADGVKIVVNSVLMSIEGHPADISVIRYGLTALSEIISETNYDTGKKCLDPTVKFMMQYPKDTMILLASASLLNKFSAGHSGLFMPKHKDAVVKRGAIEAIVQAMDAQAADVKLQNQCVSALKQLSSHAKGRMQMQHASADKAIERAMKSFPYFPSLQEGCKTLLSQLGRKQSQSISAQE
mmetsp:Transcript_39005/g.63190  ORF Transcript_39005/g.63190 Transcript_39005/m.63190 type:complete len:1245 (+) Transcript_39005:113-3847(+)|eukprot:CAMPEP_0184649544 /NCGR_PEP_ID=MMETSP0308-20130426/6942_1 /TAXON_ID=38269 /ORGANISM="Gloeochaete witrockiana, Strain SAG 46.84" /LENGTH=1244 /DNA_ID=CAMNT_0027082367 /DNA_START=29 /DNA_END=3763 /DNA_ORIENTATION=+